MMNMISVTHGETFGFKLFFEHTLFSRLPSDHHINTATLLTWPDSFKYLLQVVTNLAGEFLNTCYSYVINLTGEFLNTCFCMEYIAE